MRLPRLIACDESGYEGEHLIGGVTPVFAHAGTDLEVGEAAEVVAHLRERIRSPAVEYKANHLLRAKHRDALEWLLTRMVGRASVHLVDKAFLVTSVLTEIAPDGRTAVQRHRSIGVDVLGAVEAALRGRGVAVLRGLDPDIADALARRESTPSLDPLPAAIGATVACWSVGGDPVAVLHDRQTTLTPDRIATLRSAHPALVALTFVPSRSDARVQVADFVAGVAYRIAADALAGHDDPALLDLLRPYVDPGSLWCDEPSGAALGL